jgi:plasmid stabilization system protein ParE
MTNYPIRYLPAADQDLMDIMDYIMVDNPEAAYELVDQIDGAITRLGQFPLSCPEPDDERLKNLNYRMLVVDNDNVFYVFNNDRVQIRRILHGSRSYDHLF